MIGNWLATNLRSPNGGIMGWVTQRLMKHYNAETSIEIVKQLKMTSEGLTVVELGPGNGFSLEALLETGKCSKIHGIEISEQFRNHLSSKFQAEIESGLLTIHDSDAKDLAYLEDSTVDAVYALNVIYFLDPLDVYLRELRRTCKPNARIVFGVSDSVKKFDDAVFINTDWDNCVEQMKTNGFVDVQRSEPVQLGNYIVIFLSGLADKPN